MNPHLAHSIAQTHVDDRRRTGERHRLAAQARARRSAPAAQPRGARRGLRSLRAVFV